MAGEERGLDIDEHVDFSHRLWGIQRGALPVLMAVLALALLGAFGYGWLGRGESGQRGEPLWLTYDSIAQVQAPTVLTAHVADARGEQLELWIDQAFLDTAHIERIQPEPAESVFDQGRIIYRFPIQKGEAAIHFRYTPTKSGTIQTRVGVVGGEERELSVFVYP